MRVQGVGPWSHPWEGYIIAVIRYPLIPLLYHISSKYAIITTMQEIKNELKSIIKDLYGLDFEPELAPSPDNINADYSTNAPLKLAKSLHKPPMMIAEELLQVARNTFFEDGLAGPEKGIFATPPGFINFTLSDGYLINAINNYDCNYASDKFKGQTVICEFSDPNPFKVLHVGHLYTSIMGDSISRLLECAGAKVIRANFGGDVGLHVAKTMYALQQKPIKDLTIEDIAKCYIEGTAAYEDDPSAKAAITKLNKEIYEINAAGEPKKALSRSINANDLLHRRVAELGGPPRSLSDVGENARTGPVENNSLADLYWRGRELSYQYFDRFYDSIGVHFDKYYPESTVAALGLAKVKEQLAKGIYEYSDGAVIFDGDKYGLHTRVFINKEGVPTYEAKDVGLIFTKWQDYHFDKSVVITGSEQLDYMKVVLKSVEQYAPDLVKRTTHLTHGLVKLPGGIKMSSRKGNFLKAVDVLDMVRAALKEEHSSEDDKIALAATKYAFLKYKMGGNIIFDPKESVKMTGNSGPYLLYSCVRAKKILSKSRSAGVSDNVFKDISRFSSPEAYIPDATEKVAQRASFPGSPAYDVEGEKVHPRKDMSDNSPAERNLAKKLLEYRTTLDEAVSELAPHKVANYLYELAQVFSRFYENCEVIGSNQEAERIKLVEKYLSIMTHGLGLLGIAIPEEM